MRADVSSRTVVEVTGRSLTVARRCWPRGRGSVASVRSVAEGILFTDQYQLAMAQLYFQQGLHEVRAEFDYFFRTNPDYGHHQAGYCVAAGLGDLLDWMQKARFGAAEIDALRTHRTTSGTPRFADDFLDWLAANGDFSTVELHAVKEGRVVHPRLPVVTVRGPLATTQILESALLNHLNYPTLVATKASRVAESAHGGSVLEFGLRRAPGTAANAGARAALIGGCDFTSNVGISHQLGLDPKGTHAHSLVQVYLASGLGERDAFSAFAGLYPDDCVLLVDTVDTLGSGVPNAIHVFEELRADGHTPLGVRLDSGDLAYLAVQTARQLDDAGFPDVAIVLSGDLDELVIWQILHQIDDEAPRYDLDPAAVRARLVYGVGTRLITSQGHAALDGVYKLVALERDGAWHPSVKVSEAPTKVPVPGPKSAFRLYDDRGIATADVLAMPDEDPLPSGSLELHHPYLDGVMRTVDRTALSEAERLQERVWDGAPIGDPPTLDELRARRRRDVERLDPGVRRLVNPHVYHVSLTDRLRRLQHDLVREIGR